MTSPPFLAGLLVYFSVYKIRDKPEAGLFITLISDFFSWTHRTKAVVDK